MGWFAQRMKELKAAILTLCEPVPGLHLLRIVVSCLLVAVIALAVSKLNIFGADTGAKRKSEEIYQRLTAGLYDPGKKADAAPISVIYLDDAYNVSMRDNGLVQNWPPSYNDYANILTQLTSSLHGGDTVRPRAVFLDFIFTGSLVETDISKTACDLIENYDSPDCAQFPLLKAIEEATHFDVWKDNAHCQLTPVNKIECITDAGGIPVILARVTPEITNRWTLFQKALALRSVMSVVTVDPREYPVVRWRGKYEDRGIAGYDLSPASALFAAHCLAKAGEKDPACAAFANRKRSPEPKPENIDAYAPEFIPWPDRFRNPQSVTWGAGPHGDQGELNQASLVAPDCDVRVPSRQIHSVLINRSEITETSCLHSLSAPYHNIGGVLPTDKINELLNDRLVLVGIKDVAGSDWILSPVHGNVPGVFLHAMATDNLVKWGPRYRQISSGFFDKSDVIETVLLWVLLVIGTIGICLHKKRKANKDNHGDHSGDDISLNLIGYHVEIIDYGNYKETKEVAVLNVEQNKTAIITKLFRYISSRNIVLYISILVLYTMALFVAVYAAVNVGPPEPINWLGVYQTSIGLGIFQLRKEIAASVSRRLKSIPQLRPLIQHMEGVQRWFDLDAIAEKAAGREASRSQSIGVEDQFNNTNPTPRIKQAPKTDQA